MKQYTLAGIALLITGLSGVLTSFFIINSIPLTAAFIAWIMIGLVLLAISRNPLKLGVDPTVLSRIYEEAIDNLIQEFNMHDVQPIYAPKKYSGEPVMILSLNDNINLPRLPKRLITYVNNNYILRIPTLGTTLLKELEATIPDLSSAEEMVNTIIVDILDSANNVRISEYAGGKEIVARISSPKIKYTYKTNPSSNLYTQIIGPIIAEATNKLIKLKNMEISKGYIELSFTLIGI